MATRSSRLARNTRPTKLTPRTFVVAGGHAYWLAFSRMFGAYLGRHPEPLLAGHGVRFYLGWMQGRKLVHFDGNSGWLCDKDGFARTDINDILNLAAMRQESARTLVEQRIELTPEVKSFLDGLDAPPDLANVRGLLEGARRLPKQG